MVHMSGYYFHKLPGGIVELYGPPEERPRPRWRLDKVEDFDRNGYIVKGDPTEHCYPTLEKAASFLGRVDRKIDRN
jgi:hypothetical protein